MAEDQAQETEELTELTFGEDETEPEPKEEPAAETKEEEPAEEKQDPIEDLRKEFEEKHKTEVERLQKEINRLGFKLRKEEEVPKDDKPVFTEAQLLQMMKEHADEPEVLFNIIKEMQRQTAEGVEKSAEYKAQVQVRSKELSDIAETVFPGALKEDSQIYNEVIQTKDYLGLDKHPHGDFLALATMSLKNLPNLVANIREQVKKELLPKASDDKRKETIKAKTPVTETAKETPKPSTGAGENETAKRLGMNERQFKRYQQIMSASKKNAGAFQAGI